MIEVIKFVNGCSPSMYQGLGLTLQEESGCLFGQTGTESPLLNGVVGCSDKSLDAKKAVANIVNHFEKENLVNLYHFCILTKSILHDEYDQ